MTRSKPGPKPRDPSTHRNVIVRAYMTPGEAAKIDAARGDVERAVWVREAAVARASRKPARAPTVDAWDRRKQRAHINGGIAALVNAYGWYVWRSEQTVSGTAFAGGLQTGPEGQRLADAALRAAGYVLADEVTP